MPSKAVVLLSGGLDSTTAAAWARREGHAVYAVSFDYGQRHRKELERAKAVAKAVGVVAHVVLRVPLDQLGGSALTDAGIEVPDAPAAGNIGDQIPVTYVPARNTVFLALALAYAETVGAQRLVIGANALDYSGYPDCRLEYLEAFERMANLATKAGVEGAAITVSAPLLHLSKAEIVRLAVELGAPIHLTWSCYRGGKAPCGACESCVLRAQGFAAAGVADPGA
ncbi:MAG: 7-cyano-7-deazaguanine synthase [Thermoplasmata archaeon]|nr:7-cyano-7-deazaguanine synthase [Thermoplasmata archaeon]